VIEQTYLVGHDWGAAVAWTVAIQYPERVKKLGILNVPHPAVMIKFIGKSPRQMLKSWYIGFFQIPGLADVILRCTRPILSSIVSISPISWLIPATMPR
jgi:epoxide hydrolase 4